MSSAHPAPAPVPTAAPAAARVKFPAGPAPDPAGSREEHRIRSFHARRGRITQAQAAAIERHWDAWGVELDGRPLDLDALFAAAEPPDAAESAADAAKSVDAAESADATAGAAAGLSAAGLSTAGGPGPRPAGLPVVLEIGFGMGDATAAMAAADPATGILAVDVHTPGQGNLLALADRGGLTNIRVGNGDAVVLLRDMLAPACLAGLRVYFPDPWHKAKHHKRRLIQPAFLELVVPLLRPGAVVHCATDWEPYAEQMLEVLSAAPGLANACGAGFAPRPDFRPMTKFERQGLAKGHVVRDLLFVRT